MVHIESVGKIRWAVDSKFSVRRWQYFWVGVYASRTRIEAGYCRSLEILASFFIQAETFAVLLGVSQVLQRDTIRRPYARKVKVKHAESWGKYEGGTHTKCFLSEPNGKWSKELISMDRNHIASVVGPIT